MDYLEQIYKTNIKLDNIFLEKYSSDKLIYEKNCIEFLVELGEFINETKCFKYWTIKVPNKEKVLEEYADCITMSLTFLGTINGSLDNLPSPLKVNNILELLNYIYSKVTLLYNNKDESLIKEILSNILDIRNYLNITEKELYNACHKKQDIILERLNSDY